VAKEVVILPKSVTDTRIASNLSGSLTAARKLDEDDIATLDKVAASGKQKR
jgi:glycerol 2-dehydrogenase (NADP+)